MSKLFKAVFLLVFVFAVGVSAQTTVGNKETLGAIYINGGAMFENFSRNMHEFALSEKTTRVEEINGNLLKIFGLKGFDLGNQIKEFNRFFEKGTLKITGPIWFSIDEKYRPDLKISGIFKPEDLYAILFKELGEPKVLVASRREAELVEIEIPTRQFGLVFRIATDTISLQAKDLVADDKTGIIWENLIQSSNDKQVLIDVQINFDVVKRLNALKVQEGRHSVCLGNLMAIKNAVEMYQLETGDLMKELDLELLAEKHFLLHLYSCSDGGKYFLNNEGGVEISCSVHGSINRPKKTGELKKSDLDPRLEPFRIFRFKVSSEQALARLQITNKSLLEQWVAIGKMQIQTIQHLAANQMGHLPEEQKKFAIKIAESMKCWAEEEWFSLSVSGFSQDTLTGVIMVGLEAFRAFAMPRYHKAREAEKLQKNKNQIIMEE